MRKYKFFDSKMWQKYRFLPNLYKIFECFGKKGIFVVALMLGCTSLYADWRTDAKVEIVKCYAKSPELVDIGSKVAGSVFGNMIGMSIRDKQEQYALEVEFGKALFVYCPNMANILFAESKSIDVAEFLGLAMLSMGFMFD